MGLRKETTIKAKMLQKHVLNLYELSRGYKIHTIYYMLCGKENRLSHLRV